MSVPQHRSNPKVSVVSAESAPDMNCQGDSNVTSPLSPAKAGVGTSSIINESINQSVIGWMVSALVGAFCSLNGGWERNFDLMWYFMWH